MKSPKLRLAAGAAILAVPMFAVPAQAAVTTTTTLPSGVTLEPGEENATAVVMAAPGKAVHAVVRPQGCDSDDCAYEVNAENNVDPNLVGPQERANPLSKASRIALLHGASASAVSEGDAAIEQSFGEIKSASGVSVYDNGVSRDHLCSIAGCFVWELRMSSHSFSDSQGWTWYTYQRYGRVGSVTCGHTLKGFDWNQTQCHSVNDPHKTAAYASMEGELKSSPCPAICVSRTHYIHRHNTVDQRWLVTQGPDNAWALLGLAPLMLMGLRRRREEALQA